jgi:hypothetical protein
LDPEIDNEVKMAHQEKVQSGDPLVVLGSIAATNLGVTKPKSDTKTGAPAPRGTSVNEEIIANFFAKYSQEPAG